MTRPDRLVGAGGAAAGVSCAGVGGVSCFTAGVDGGTGVLAAFFLAGGAADPGVSSAFLEKVIGILLLKY